MIVLDKNPKICLNCGIEYRQLSISQKYCGSRKAKIGCSFSVKRNQTKDYIKKNSERMKELNKKWVEKNKDKIKRKRIENNKKGNKII